MLVVNLNQAKARLGDYIRRVCEGERVIVCRRNRPIAELRPVPGAGSRVPLRLGILAGEFVVPDDFDAPLDDFEATFYEDNKGKQPPFKP